ncbi:hypothetical protein RAS1_33640 [Phycisphaerae bacterium RAS1]|nr:hypothetical protein RAS1_33640 [Phycisphaerae bacterium RAS1]
MGAEGREFLRALYPLVPFSLPLSAPGVCRQ